MPETEPLARYLSAMKRVHGGNYGWTGSSQGGATPFGAYGMLKENWAQWSREAGIGGHSMYDPTAQDSVAAYWGQKLHQRYGDWDMVAASWFGGADSADLAMQSGKGIMYFKNPETASFIQEYKEAFEQSEGATLNKAQRKWINPQGAPRGWLSPVAGDSEWSGGSWMPNTKTHRGRTHAAIDVYAKRGAPVVAPVGGTVLKVGKSKIGGNTVTLRGTDGLTYYFAHMDVHAEGLKNGAQVRPGAHLGTVGNTGSARRTKPHLHFSIRKGNTPVNPKTYLQGAKNAPGYYAPEGADHATLEDPPMSSKLDGLLGSISNKVAGGERVDYRTLGMPEEEGSEQVAL